MHFCLTMMIHLIYIYIFVIYVSVCICKQIYIYIYILQLLLIPFWYATATSDDASSLDRLRPCQTSGCPSGTLKKGGGSTATWSGGRWDLAIWERCVGLCEKKNIYLYIFIFIYPHMCVCVCLCVCLYVCARPWWLLTDHDLWIAWRGSAVEN